MQLVIKKIFTKHSLLLLGFLCLLFLFSLERGPQVANADVVGSFDTEVVSGVVGSFDPEVSSGVVGSLDPEIQREVVGFFDPEVQRVVIPAVTTQVQRQVQTQRQAQIEEAIDRPSIRTFESPGCNGSISIWGVWNADT